jgi:hypothetical protein
VLASEMSFWVTHEMSCSGQALDSRATLDFSWLSFHPGTARVPNWRCLAHMTFFVFSSLSYFFLEFCVWPWKNKNSHSFCYFFIFEFYLRWLIQLVFFLILSPFTFYIFQIWSHFFNWFLLFEMIFKTLFFYI